MEVIVDPQKPVDFSTSAAIGNFDGVHLGHREIINLINDIANQKSTKSCLLTFEPHPQKVLAGRDVSLIIPVNEKLSLLEKENSWLLCSSNDEIIWVIDRRLDNRFKITTKTNQSLKITYLAHEKNN